MKTIRIYQLYKYFFQSAVTLLNHAYGIKDLYENGKISYRRAWKELSNDLRLLGQRLKLCNKLYNGEVPPKWSELWEEYKYLTKWSAS